ncbi:hypothetical protein V6Z12_A04G159400 [Gossypium hirsutum]|uniref:Uncharacterized protein n=2 Tax=Gossypium TaxID=3633 RepID=A0A5D2GXX4_GOSDA|nr:hypothetical protein ES288_A04G164200v1 [Gossypium darwinii]TYH22864.1 hypothetical protein ES288_A04G164200v1 [Gossypium darwinii]TYI33843.1 hypothetical protein ES332_A04G162800v1 [Gossypium tomentosum]TYI33844.1 hypothetical protein ES332_A04G162800v1 [Gossypium tomentosum]
MAVPRLTRAGGRVTLLKLQLMLIINPKALLVLFDIHDQVQSMENAVCERVRELLVSKVPCIWKSLRTCYLFYFIFTKH